MFSIRNPRRSDILISGIGVTSAVGQGKDAFVAALMEGRHAFGVMQRQGRQKGTAFLGAEIPSLGYPECLSNRLLRTASFSGQAAMVTLHEAWEDAKLDRVAPHGIGLVIGGSNLQQRELQQTHESFADRLQYVRGSYGMAFMDSDLCGLCTEQFGIQGFAYTVGGASASGQVAIIQAIQAVQAGQVDVCIALGALMDLSYWECQGLRALGAMGTDRYAGQPAAACRPFDKGRDGFIYGEACGAVVLERAASVQDRAIRPYGAVTGCAIGMDKNRNPNPSYEGEMRVIQKALEQAGLSPQDIDYVNPHGTGSPIGDETEARALLGCRLSHAYINATKSITGHGLTAAGAVEVIATLLQMREERLHPTRNLDDPLQPSCNWVRDQSVPHVIVNALNLSMGFGGINTAVCLQKYEGTG